MNRPSVFGTSVLMVLGVALLQSFLQPELAAHRTPLFRLSALFLVLSSAGLARGSINQKIFPAMDCRVISYEDALRAFARQ